MISQNRAVPILLVLTFAFILYLAGCFGADETTTASDETPTPVATPTTPPVVDPELDAASASEPFFHTVEQDDRIGSIASTYCVNEAQILRANPDLNPNFIVVGQQILIPGATTACGGVEVTSPDRPDGVTVEYAVRSGDTFGAIAQEWTVSIDALSEANPEVDPATLQVSQVLTIPPWGTGLDPADLRPRTTPTPVVRQPGEILEHEVQPGDNTAAIAALYGVSLGQIVEANGLDEGGNNIQVGQVLLIPPPPTPEP